MGDSHGHVTSASGRNKKSLGIVFGLTLFYLIVEIIGGLWTGSLALLADAGHMLTDVAGVGLALLAIWFAEKPLQRRTLMGFTGWKS
jgi:cobalt-zinc-cadmium efflux system protein